MKHDLAIKILDNFILGTCKRIENRRHIKDDLCVTESDKDGHQRAIDKFTDQSERVTQSVHCLQEDN